MANKNVRVVFDRRKKVQETGKGWVEICIYLENRVRRYIKLLETTPEEWPTVQQSLYVQEAITKYERIRMAMDVFGEPITLEVLNKHLGVEKKPKNTKVLTAPDAKEPEVDMDDFLDFMTDAINKEKLAAGTLKHKIVVLEAVRRFGKLETMADLTPQNIRAFDRWLRETGERTNVTIHGYHKRVRKYVRMAYQQGLIDSDPYEQVSFPRGKSKERQPLTEEELRKMRKLTLHGKEEKVRDLFIFSAYTGLAYCDTQDFNFKAMTEEHDGLYYIDGSRIKTGTKFFTPILAPAMEVLKKYNYRLPHISNQKLNDYLHLVGYRLRLNKPLTFHVARHSFATLSLAHDIPIENVARMLGHTDIRTTQIYAKILKTNIERHALALSNVIK